MAEEAYNVEEVGLRQKKRKQGEGGGLGEEEEVHKRTRVNEVGEGGEASLLHPSDLGVVSELSENIHQGFEAFESFGKFWENESSTTAGQREQGDGSNPGFEPLPRTRPDEVEERHEVAAEEVQRDQDRQSVDTLRSSTMPASQDARDTTVHGVEHRARPPSLSQDNSSVREEPAEQAREDSQQHGQDNADDVGSSISSVAVVGQRTPFPILRIEEEREGIETLVFIRSMPGVNQEDYLSYRYVEVIPWLPSQDTAVRLCAFFFLAIVWVFMFMEIEEKLLVRYNNTLTNTVASSIRTIVKCQLPDHFEWTDHEMYHYLIENDLAEVVSPIAKANMSGSDMVSFVNGVGNISSPLDINVSREHYERLQNLYAGMNETHVEESGCVWSPFGHLVNETKKKFQSHNVLSFRERDPRLFDAMMVAFPFGPRSVIVGLYLRDEELFKRLFLPAWVEKKPGTSSAQAQASPSEGSWVDAGVVPRGFDRRGLRADAFPVLPLVTLVTETIIVPEFMLMRESFFHYNEVGLLIVGYLFVHFAVSVYNGLKCATGLHVLSNSNYSVVYYYAVRTLSREVNSLIIFSIGYGVWTFCNEWLVTACIFFLMLWRLLEFIDVVATFFSESVAVFMTMRLYKRVVLSVRPFRKVVVAQTV